MSTEAPPKPETTYKCGTLEYTKRGLMGVFVWLLWGDLVYHWMENIDSQIFPLLLGSMGASNLVIMLYSSTIQSALTVIICPIVSFKSDRYRSRWGRRIPFLAAATPFVGLFMVLTGYSVEIGEFLATGWFQQSGMTQLRITLIFMGFAVVCYQIFSLVISSIYYYLFNDVVPERFLGKFLALFRAVAAGGGSLFSFVFFPHILTHWKEMFIGFGLLYTAGFLAMCVMVKEGEYPPPPPVEKGKGSKLAPVKAYFKECFCHKFYWYFYITYALWFAQGSMGTFDAHFGESER